MVLRYCGVIKLLLGVCVIFLFSCGAKLQPVAFPVQGADQALYGLGREAAEGRLDFSKTKKLEYRFAAAVAVSPPASLEIEYSLTGES
jgi:hypothetical protein